MELLTQTGIRNTRIGNNNIGCFETQVVPDIDLWIEEGTLRIIIDKKNIWILLNGNNEHIFVVIIIKIFKVVTLNYKQS